MALSCQQAAAVAGGGHAGVRPRGARFAFLLAQPSRSIASPWIPYTPMYSRRSFALSACREQSRASAGWCRGSSVDSSESVPGSAASIRCASPFSSRNPRAPSPLLAFHLCSCTRARSCVSSALSARSRAELVGSASETPYESRRVGPADHFGGVESRFLHPAKMVRSASSAGCMVRGPRSLDPGHCELASLYCVAVYRVGVLAAR